MPRAARAAVSFLLAFVAAGCAADLESVRNFAAVSADSANYGKLVNDYAESPVRQKEYQPDSQQAALDEIAAAREAQKKDLLALQVLVSEYMDALGRLASDEVVNFDSQFDLLTGELKAKQILGEREADAYGKIAKILTNAAADGWRRKKLGTIIADTNADFQIVTGALHAIVDRDFRASLGNEQVAIAKYYGGILAQARANPPQQAGIVAVTDILKKRLAEVDARIAAVDAYAAILDRIAKGHQELYEHRANLKDKAVRKDLERYAKDLRRAYKTLQEI